MVWLVLLRLCISVVQQQIIIEGKVKINRRGAETQRLFRVRAGAALAANDAYCTHAVSRSPIMPLTAGVFVSNKIFRVLSVLRG